MVDFGLHSKVLGEESERMGGKIVLEGCSASDERSAIDAKVQGCGMLEHNVCSWIRRMGQPFSSGDGVSEGAGVPPEVPGSTNNAVCFHSRAVPCAPSHIGKIHCVGAGTHTGFTNGHWMARLSDGPLWMAHGWFKSF